MRTASTGSEPVSEDERMFRTVRTATLEIGYEETGPAEGPPVILLHGWPSDPHDWDGVVPELAAGGCRVLVPWLRGYGPTRFLHRETPRSGQISGTLWMRSASRTPTSPAMIGAGAPPASSPRCGQSGCAGWFRSAATTSRTLPYRGIPPRRRKSIGSGTNGISIPNAVAPGSNRTAATLPGYCGGCGRRTGNSTIRLSTRP